MIQTATKVKERPIIFSGESVRAILADHKTQTRRVPTSANSTVDGWHWPHSRFSSLDFDDPELCVDGSYRCGCLKYLTSSLDDDPTIGHRVRSVYYPGDRLWLRETFTDGVEGCPRGVTYRADHRDPRGDGPAHPIGWKSPLFMPRRLSRITLEIVNVRVERVQEISHEDAIAEGVDVWIETLKDKTGDLRSQRLSMKQLAWSYLWDSINAKTHPWSSNPWVWVIEFKRLEAT